MKLLRVGPAGQERPAALDADGTVRDLSRHIDDIAPATLANGFAEMLEELDLSACPEITGERRIGPPLANPGHFIAIGLNYADHARETGAAIPEEPVIFSKAPSCIVGPNDDVVLPASSQKSDWEVELAVVIGKTADEVSEADALSHVFGYTICNDVSERAWQKEGTGQWIKGKSAPTFGPLGPWLVTADAVADPQALDLFLDLNGERMQTGNTTTMIFSVATLISFISHRMRLVAGDIITTGTPPGVGGARNPPRFLREGDMMHLGIAGLGTQTLNVVRRERA